MFYLLNLSFRSLQFYFFLEHIKCLCRINRCVRHILRCQRLEYVIYNRIILRLNHRLCIRSCLIDVIIDQTLSAKERIERSLFSDRRLVTVIERLIAAVVSGQIVYILCSFL